MATPNLKLLLNAMRLGQPQDPQAAVFALAEALMAQEEVIDELKRRLHVVQSAAHILETKASRLESELEALRYGGHASPPPSERPPPSFGPPPMREAREAMPSNRPPARPPSEAPPPLAAMAMPPMGMPRAPRELAATSPACRSRTRPRHPAQIWASAAGTVSGRIQRASARRRRTGPSSTRPGSRRC